MCHFNNPIILFYFVSPNKSREGIITFISLLISASGIPLIPNSTGSSTCGLPLAVNFVGFHPNSCKYCPICIREPRLNSTVLYLLIGSRLFLATACSYSSLVSLPPLATLLMFPSFLRLGVKTIYSILGLNILKY